MAGIFTNIVAFIVAIAILVAVHEWGHYIVARWCGVKVLRFSIGFGRPFFKRRYGEDQTEFCIAAIPIGGYVKLLDERDSAVALSEQPRAFNRQSVPAKIAILAAGPVLNFLFAILAYWFMYMAGVPGVKPVIDQVEADSIAAMGGLRNGDEIVNVGDAKVATWEGAILAILSEMLDDGEIELTVLGADGEQRAATLETSGRASELTEPGRLFTGLGFSGWTPTLEPIIDELTPGGPAEQAGFISGDKVLSAAGEPMASWSDWVQFIRARPGETVAVRVMRGGDELDITISIGQVEEADQTIGRIGAGPWIDPELMTSMRSEQRYGPVAALPVAIKKTWKMMALTVSMAGSMITGDVSVKNISGPINIAQYAGQSAGIGLIAFLGFLAIVSISLGIINLLPVPLLDGGQIMYQLVEALTGSPLSERAQIVGQQMGILFLLVLMSFAFYNDLTRIFG